MKYCLEFGIRGGQTRDNLVLTSRTLAVSLASDLVRMFTNTNNSTVPGVTVEAWLYPLRKNATRVYWQSPTHFVIISRLDGVDRGAAAAKLWEKSHGGDGIMLWTYRD